MRQKPQRLSSVAEVVRVLGGTTRAAEVLLVRPNAVSMMLNRDTIPPAYHLRLYMLLADLGFEIDTEAVFGYSIDMMKEAERVSKLSHSNEVHAA